MKVVLAWLSAKRQRESSFHLCGGPVKLVEVWLCARRFSEAGASQFMKDRQSSFLHCGGPVQLAEACLFSRKDRETSFHHCGGAVNLVLAW